MVVLQNRELMYNLLPLPDTQYTPDFTAMHQCVQDRNYNPT